MDKLLEFYGGNNNECASITQAHIHQESRLFKMYRVCRDLGEFAKDKVQKTVRASLFSEPAIAIKQKINAKVKVVERLYPSLKTIRLKGFQEELENSRESVEFNQLLFGKYDKLPLFRGSKNLEKDFPAPPLLAKAKWQEGFIFTKGHVDDSSDPHCKMEGNTSGVRSYSVSQYTAHTFIPEKGEGWMGLHVVGYENAFSTSQHAVRNKDSSINEGEIASLAPKSKVVFSVRYEQNKPIEFVPGDVEAIKDCPRTVEATEYLQNLMCLEAISPIQTLLIQDLLEKWSELYPTPIDLKKEFYQDMAPSLEMHKIRLGKRQIHRDLKVFERHRELTAEISRLPFGRQIKAFYDAFFMGSHDSQFKEREKLFKEIVSIIDAQVKQCQSHQVDCQVLVAENGSKIEVKPSNQKLFDSAFTHLEKKAFQQAQDDLHLLFQSVDGIRGSPPKWIQHAGIKTFIEMEVEATPEKKSPQIITRKKERAFAERASRKVFERSLKGRELKR